MEPILQGTLLALGYGIVLFGFIKLFGVKYTDLTKTTAHIKNGILFPVAIAGTLLVVFSTLNGWLVPAFSSPYRNTEAWMIVVPAALFLGALARLIHARWRSFSPMGIVYMIVGLALVGFTEELLTRGVIVHLFSQAGLPQYIVMLGSSVLFGLLHGMNYFNGQDRKTTISQMIFSTIMGMALYISLLIYGTLWVPIVLHALFDLSLLALGTENPNTIIRKPSPLELISTLVVYSGAIIAWINIMAAEIIG